MIYLFLADGFEEIEAITPLDILKRMGADIVTVGVGGSYIRGAHDIIVKADITLEEVSDDYVMLIFPGGMPGTQNLQNTPRIIELIKKAIDNDKYLCAICAAPKIFGELGLLKGKQAVCFPKYEDCLLGAQISDKPVVIDGKFITSKGAGTAAEFGFAIVATLFGEDKANALKEKMLYE